MAKRFWPEIEKFRAKKTKIVKICLFQNMKILFKLKNKKEMMNKK